MQQNVKMLGRYCSYLYLPFLIQTLVRWSTVWFQLAEFFHNPNLRKRSANTIQTTSRGSRRLLAFNKRIEIRFLEFGQIGRRVALFFFLKKGLLVTDIKRFSDRVCIL